MRRAPVVVLLLANLTSLSCEPEQRIEMALAEAMLDSLLTGAEVLPLPPLTQLQRVRTLALPDSVVSYALASPTDVAVRTTGSGSLFVLDGHDRAVHVFDEHFTYQGSLFGGGREPALFPSAYALAVNRDGMAAVSDLGWSRFVTYRSMDSQPEMFSPPRWDEYGASDLAFAGNQRLLDHWFPMGLAYRSGAWGDTLPLVRTWEIPSKGSLPEKRGFGRIDALPGTTFTAALNRGLIQVWNDTLWFARRWDASVLVFSLSRPRSTPERVVRLPLFFHMLPPREVWYRTADLWQVIVEDHLTAFCVGPRGRLMFGQAVAYPRIPNQFRPTTVLTVMDGAGKLQYFDLGGTILDLSIFEGHLVAIIRRSTGEMGQFRRVVDIFALPQSWSRS